MASDEQPNGGGPRDEIAKLAGIAADASIATGVADLNGEVVNWFQDQTDAYVASVGGNWTDDGLAAWIAQRQEDMNRAWRADIATLTGDTLEPPAEPAAIPDASAILEAAEAWKRDGADLPPQHYATLVQAVMRRRGPFALRLEREMKACRPGEDINERLALHRDEMRELFRADAEAVIKEAGG